MFSEFKKEMNLGGRKLTFETGKIARQADGAVMITYGETKVLSLDDVEVVPSMEQAKHLVGVERSAVGAVAVADLQISLETAAAVVRKIEVNRNTLRRVKMADCVSQFRNSKDVVSYGKVLKKAVLDLYPQFVEIRGGCFG